MSDAGVARLSDQQVAELLRMDMIVGYRPDGLFSRLMCLLNTLRIAQVLGKEPAFLWETSPVGGNRTHEYADGIECLLRDDRIANHERRSDGGALARVNMEHFMPVALPGESRATVYSEVRRLAHGLVLRDGRTLGDSLTEGRFDVAVHVRHGDTDHIRFLLSKFFPSSGWFMVLDMLVATQPDHTIYVASDDAAFVHEAKRRHPEQVVTFAEVGQASDSKLQRDFDEGMMLAQASRLIAPRRSLFSLFPSLVGGLEPEAPEVVLGIEGLTEDLVNVALRDYAVDMDHLLKVIDGMHGVPETRIARQRNSTKVARERIGRLDMRTDVPPPSPEGARPPARDPQAMQDRVLGILARLRPRGCSVPLARFGGESDGGYVIPDDLSGITGAISIGVGRDVSFDEALAARGIPVILVDHTVATVPSDSEGFTFIPRPWAATSDDGAITLGDLVEQLDALVGAPGGDLLLKFDVEGAEWAILPDLDAALLRRFRIICGELHGLVSLDRGGRFATVRRSVNRLTEGHTAVHLHANNAGGLGWVQGVPIPAVVEVSLLRNDRGTFRDRPTALPTEFDRPNVRRRPDVVWTPFAHPATVAPGSSAEPGLGRRIAGLGSRIRRRLA